MLKQFEQEQWELFDTPAKEVATKFWIQLGYECIENPDDYNLTHSAIVSRKLILTHQWFWG